MLELRFFRLIVVVFAMIVLVPLESSAQRQESQADPKAVWTTSCQEEVERRLRSARPRAREIRILADSMMEWQESESETGVWGNGQVMESGSWESYVFRCIYNFRQGRLTSVDTNFQDPIGESSAPRYDAEQGAPWTAACKHSIHEKVREAHPRAESIRIDAATMKEWEESEQETGVSGGGQFVGGRGNDNRFIFRCTYSLEKHSLTTSNWQIRE
jgi:hypothetical protein